MTDATPRLTRNRFHLFANDSDPDVEPTYVATVAITNADQLLAEKQAKGLGIQVPTRDEKTGRVLGDSFHFSALWVWAAAVRLGHTTEKFKPFTEAFQWEALEKPKPEDDQEPEPDPTSGASAPSTEPG